MGRGRKPKFTIEQEQAIARRYATGDESMSSIAETLGVTRALIGQIVVRQGVETRHHQHALTPSQEDEVVLRFTEGSTGQDLQEIFGVDRKTITEIVRRRGGPLRRCGRKRHFESNKEWRQDPQVRLRNLVLTARSSAEGRGLEFDSALFDAFPVPPETCTCCGCLLDYTIHPKNGSARNRSPSLDRCDNNLGYVVGNVYVVCYRCNKLKSNATLDELRAIVAYMENNLERRT